MQGQLFTQDFLTRGVTEDAILPGDIDEPRDPAAFVVLGLERMAPSIV